MRSHWNPYLLSCRKLGSLGEGRVGIAAGSSKLKRCRFKGCSWMACCMMSLAPMSGIGYLYPGSSKSGGAGERTEERLCS